MKVILTEDINPLGAMGAVVDVARGYARNYLIPQGKAMEATKGNLARVEKAKAKYLQVQATEREKAQAQVAHLEGVSVTIAQRVAEEERLYGSVTAAMIAEALASQGFTWIRSSWSWRNPSRSWAPTKLPSAWPRKSRPRSPWKWCPKGLNR